MSKRIYTHKHHIIPRHAGGSNDPSNLVELTTEQHALAHKKLFFIYGRWQDELAYLGLSGMIGKEEIIRRTTSEANKGKTFSEETRQKMSAAGKGRVFTEEHKRNISKSSNPYIRTPEHNAMQSAKQKGKKFTEEHKRKLSEAKKGIKRTEETKRKISEAGKKRWAKKKGAVV